MGGGGASARWIQADGQAGATHSSAAAACGATSSQFCSGQVRPRCPAPPLRTCMLACVTAWPRVKALSFSYGSGTAYLQGGGEGRAALKECSPIWLRLSWRGQRQHRACLLYSGWEAGWHMRRWGNQPRPPPPLQSTPAHRCNAPAHDGLDGLRQHLPGGVQVSRQPLLVQLQLAAPGDGGCGGQAAEWSGAWMLSCERRLATCGAGPHPQAQAPCYTNHGPSAPHLMPRSVDW